MLAINGAPYTLLTSLTYIYNGGYVADYVDGIGRGNLAENGNYALAFNLDGTGLTFSGPLVGPGTGYYPAPFSGTFEGLGHTITNLTINDSSNQNVGLIGENDGTVRDIGLVGGSVIGGGAAVGALVGYNDGGAIVTQAYATGAFSGGSSESVGGLIGANFGTNQASLCDERGQRRRRCLDCRGLVGDNGGTITQAYATGVVKQRQPLCRCRRAGRRYTMARSGRPCDSAVSGGSAAYVGGLTGLNYGNTITQAYATGAVSGGSGA